MNGYSGSKLLAYMSAKNEYGWEVIVNNNTSSKLIILILLVCIVRLTDFHALPGLNIDTNLRHNYGQTINGHIRIHLYQEIGNGWLTYLEDWVRVVS